jgi:hypothetical protein
MNAFAMAAACPLLSGKVENGNSLHLQIYLVHQIKLVFFKLMAQFEKPFHLYKLKRFRDASKGSPFTSLSPGSQQYGHSP